MENNFQINLRLKGRFDIKHFDKEGNLIEEYEIPNIITNVGKADVADLIGGVNGIAAFDYIAIGTGTTAEAATDTALGTEVARGQATKSLITTNVTNDTLQLQFAFNFTSSNAITEAGVFNASTGGDMLCRTTFSAVNVADGDSLQITYKITVS